MCIRDRCMEDYLYIIDLQKNTLIISQAAVKRFKMPGNSCLLYTSNRNGGQLSELDGTEWLYPPGAPSTGRAPKGALQR